MQKTILSFIACVFIARLFGQSNTQSNSLQPGEGVAAHRSGDAVSLQWNAGNRLQARLVLNESGDAPLFTSMTIGTNVHQDTVLRNADPVFLLRVGKRDLVSQNGWNIFFDKVPLKPFSTVALQWQRRSIAVGHTGNRTLIRVSSLYAPGFEGYLEITIYPSSGLLNIAAVMTTQQDSTAILYDAGVVSANKCWDDIAWADVYDSTKTAIVHAGDTSVNQRVKYRSLIAANRSATLAVFPAPHQYFYPLDEAFNLSFTWYGADYNKMFPGYGIGIRQDPQGDKRYVPWFNAPPHTAQRLSFFCLIGDAGIAPALENVKAFTHGDSYLHVPGYKTMSSHFHNEHIMNVVLAGKPVPPMPAFVKVFKRRGIDIVHLAEFHYTAHPKGPDSVRLRELSALFHECRRLSSKDFLLLPGEEPNEFFGGHWLAFFPRPVYWVMSRPAGVPFLQQDGSGKKVYHVGNADEMLSLLQKENGLAWTAHPRTKGSTGYPDAYTQTNFFTSERFLGAAWKAMPADLSQPRLGKRVLDLMDDLNNQGFHKKVLAEADLFSVEPENEMYAHLNVNYLRLSALPSYDDGWNQVLLTLSSGHFFSTTGEVLIPDFTVGGRTSGQTLQRVNNKSVPVSFSLQWTFPLAFAEIISGDGTKTYRQRIDLTRTQGFGQRHFKQTANLQNRKWVRLEVWDVAANGAFTQTVWLQ